MPQIQDYLTHVNNPADVPFLKIPLFDVNIRLANSNDAYDQIVTKVCNLIEYCALTTFEGYKKPHGMSGANVGMPFNIIAIVKNRGGAEYATIMINPTIIAYGGKEVITDSNCGSIRLKNPIKVRRAEKVLVQYYDREYFLHTEWFNRERGSFTIQHEVDHNRGILITDDCRRAKILG